MTEQNDNYVPILTGKPVAEFCKQRGGWILANVEQQLGWPQKRMLVIYRGRKVLMLPPTKKYYAAAAVFCMRYNLDEGKKFLMEFLSALSWHRPAKISVVEWTNSSSQGAMTKHLRLNRYRAAGMTALFFRPTDLPNPTDQHAQLALAFFREGLSLDHEAYSFLSFYKIINLQIPDGKKQKVWIRENLPSLKKISYLKKEMDEITKNHPDPAKHIYHECRCAVAHASIDDATTYNPEDIKDEIRFFKIKPIICALAKIMIETKFGIKTTNTIFKEHLYELAGFHQIFGEELSSALKSGKSLPIHSIKFPSKISLRLWNKKKFNAFEKLSVTVDNITNGIVTLGLTRDGLVTIPLWLDFPKEKLVFDPERGVYFEDNGTKVAARRIVDVYEFYAAVFCNAVVEVWNDETNKVLGRLLEYLPVNVMPHKIDEHSKEQVRLWKEQIKLRKK